MGQYFKIVNLDKGEYYDPDDFRSGAKLMEIACNLGATGALAILLATSNDRGGGDLALGYPECEKDTPETRTKQMIIDAVGGRWVGDRVVFVGDYTEDGDVPGFENESGLWDKFSAINHANGEVLNIGPLIMGAFAVDGYALEMIGKESPSVVIDDARRWILKYDRDNDVNGQPKKAVQNIPANAV